MSKNVAVFVDVANIFYAAKAAGADIDYVTLLKAAVAGRDFVRAYAYTGLDPENENQRNFHSFLARNNYKVVSKDIRKYGDGKVKANLDIELVVDMMKTARNLDVAVVISGDGDFAPAIRAVQEMGVRVEVISFRGNTSSDLIEVADVFTDIIQVARVDRDSSRSGRRVAGDEEDLSMTEVPDKQTEGRGGRRGRGRVRDGGRTPDAAVAVSAGSTDRDGRFGGRVAGRGSTGGRIAASAASASAGSAASAGSSGGHFVAMPGEKLSRVQPVDADAIEEASEEPEELVEGLELEAGAVEQPGDGTGRRRRRRGGRGRGHGARTPEEALVDGASEELAEDPEEAEAVPSSAPAQRPNQFGSVWDSQIGMAGRPARLAPIAPEEDDFAEPEIPEYLLAERRRSGGGGGGGRGRNQGGRGGARSAYASAVDRERYGRGPSTRYPEPARQSQPQSQPQPPRRRDERPARPVQQPQQHRGLPRGGGRDSNEPWSEVPPELEELLRAQLATKLSRPIEQPVGGRAEGASEAPEQTAEAETAVKPAARRGGRRQAEAAPEQSPVAAAQTAPPEAAAEAPAPAAKPATRARRKPAGSATAATAETAAAEAPAQSAEPAAPAEPGDPAAPAAPKRRAPARRKTASTEPAAE